MRRNNSRSGPSVLTMSVALLALVLLLSRSRYVKTGLFGRAKLVNRNLWSGIVVPPFGQKVTGVSFDEKGEIDREKHRRELVRYLGVDPAREDLSRPRVLVIGADTVVGAAIVRKLERDGVNYVTLNSAVHFNLSVEDAWAALDNLDILRIIFVHRPILFWGSRSDGGSYIQALNEEYLMKAHALIRKRGIPVLYVACPPHFSFYKKLSETARVVLVPSFSDTSTIHDGHNMIAKVVRQCEKRGKAELELFDESEEYVNVIDDEIVDLILGQDGFGLFAFSGEQMRLGMVRKNECDLWINQCVHRYDTINISAMPNSVYNLTHQHMPFDMYRVRSDNSTYLTIVLAGRNDLYAGDFISRAQTFLNKVDQSLEKFPLADIEIVYVDYATPWGKQKLHEILTIPKNLKGRVTFVVVPEEFQKQKMKLYDTTLGFFEYFAKNIGIRRANGQFVLAMNPDSLLSHNFFAMCEQRQFNEGTFYISDRIMMNETGKTDVEYVNINEPWRRNQHFAKFWLLANNKDTFGYDYGLGGLGDFTMLSKKLWMALNAYDELGANFYVDHEFKAKMMKLVSGGYAAYLPNAVLHQYHVHMSSKMPKPSLDTVHATLDDYMKYGQLRQSNGAPDTPEWGCPQCEFETYTF